MKLGYFFCFTYKKIKPHRNRYLLLFLIMQWKLQSPKFAAEKSLKGGL